MKFRASLQAAVIPAVAGLWSASSAQARVFGLDTSSAANTNAPSQTQWNNAKTSGWAAAGIPSFDFAFIRSSRGGTADATRVDDLHFYDSITRATAAGMLAGSYHYERADVTTHTAIDDANHCLERAGMYMKPGYLLPVFDLEAGNTQNTTAQLTAWGMDWINTIFNAKGIYPIVYTNSSYNNDEVSAELAFTNFGSTPKTGPRTYQWLARPLGNITTDEPGAANNYPNPYGVWDPNFIARTNSRDPAINPWNFWQNGSAHIDPSGTSGNQFLVDFDAANGNIEFVKDFLVPALWTNAGSGDWGTLANWNSDNPAYVPADTSTGPAPRLPNNQSLDWVKLQNTGGGTVTISSGAQTVRKFYTQQPLNITGGSLSVGYVPGSGGKFDVPSEFNAAVTLSAGAAYSAHTTQIDGGGGGFTINGGTVTFSDIQLASHASNAGKINLAGNATFAQTGGTGTSVIRSTGSLAQAGSIVLLSGGGTPTFNVSNGSAAVDLNVRVGVSGNPRLTKSGAGTMHLANSNSYSGGTTVTGGVLQIAADNRLGAVPGVTTANHIILDGGTIRTGAEVDSVNLTNAGSGYTSFPTLTINGGGSNVLPASANVLAGLTSIGVSNGGSGYVNQVSTPAANSAGTFVDIVGGGGTGATAFATVSGGVVTGITVTNPGTGYTSMPTIHISSTGLDIDPGTTTSLQAGSGALALVNSITLQSIALNDSGFDYSTPSITLTGGGGSGATASATSTPNWTIPSARGIQLGAGGGTLEQTAGHTLTYGGVISGSGALAKIGSGTLVLTGANIYTGATTVQGGLLAVANNLTASASLNVLLGTFELSAGGGSNRVIKTPSVVIGPGGKLDLKDNKLIVAIANQTGSWTGSSYTGITGLIKSGKGTSNTWNGGTGILTSQSAAIGSNLTTLGVARASDIRPATVSTTATWAGQTITGTDTLVMYTYGGDATLDGQINIDDYVKIDTGIAAGLTGWSNGDFNYDGKVNIDDYSTVIDANIGNQNGIFPTSGGLASASPGVTAIPEPAGGAMLGLTGLLLVSRRRRRIMAGSCTHQQSASRLSSVG